MLGLAMVLDVTGSVRVDAVGVRWGLGAAVGLAAYYVLSANGQDQVPPVVTAWAGMCVGAVALLAVAAAGALPLAAPRGPVSLAGAQTSWLVPVLCLALPAGALAYVSGILGARLLGATLASFLGLTEVLFAVVFAWLLLDQVPAPLQIAGGAVVVAGVALVRLAELRPVARGRRPAQMPDSSPVLAGPAAVPGP